MAAVLKSALQGFKTALQKTIKNFICQELHLRNTKQLLVLCALKSKGFLGLPTLVRKKENVILEHAQDTKNSNNGILGCDQESKILDDQNTPATLVAGS